MQDAFRTQISMTCTAACCVAFRACQEGKARAYSEAAPDGPAVDARAPSRGSRDATVVRGCASPAAPRTKARSGPDGLKTTGGDRGCESDREAAAALCRARERCQWPRARTRNSAPWPWWREQRATLGGHARFSLSPRSRFTQYVASNGWATSALLTQLGPHLELKSSLCFFSILNSTIISSNSHYILALEFIGSTRH